MVLKVVTRRQAGTHSRTYMYMRWISTRTIALYRKWESLERLKHLWMCTVILLSVIHPTQTKLDLKLVNIKVKMENSKWLEEKW